MANWRLYFVLALLLLLGAGAIGKLAFIQIVHHGYYKALAQGQQNISDLARGERGVIFLQDKHGTLYTLATNQKVPYVFASPAEIEDAENTATALSDVLSLLKEPLKEQLQAEGFFEILKKRAHQKRNRSACPA